MTRINSVALNQTWSRRIQDRELLQDVALIFRIVKMTKRTAIFRCSPIEEDIPHNVWKKWDMTEFKATHELVEEEVGTIKRIFLLSNGIRFHYKYKKEVKKFYPNADISEICKALPPCFSEYVKDKECPICYDKNSEIMTSCGHHYCNDCFSKISECAMCKKPK